MDNLETTSLNVFYDKTTTVVGGKPVYQSGNRYIFWNIWFKNWMVSISTNTNSSFTTNEVKKSKSLLMCSISIFI